MAKIFQPRRTNQSLINSDTNVKNTMLENGEMLISYANNAPSVTTTNNRHNIYFGNGSTKLGSLAPSIYGDTSQEPVITITNPGSSYNTTKKCLDYIIPGRTFAQTIGALKKAIECSSYEQDNWKTIPTPAPHYFINNFESGGSSTTGDSRITIKTDSSGTYLDLSNIVDIYNELYIKATYDDGNGNQIVMPIMVPKKRLYSISETQKKQFFRNGYQINASNGGCVSFRIYQERIYFDEAWINGHQCLSTNDYKIDWAFSWNERETVTPS